MKRFISIILAAIMILSSIPAVGAVTYSGGESPQSYKYVFNSYAHTASPGTKGIALAYNLNSIDKTISEASPNKWGLAGIRENGAWKYKRAFATYENRLQWSFDLSAGGYENKEAAIKEAIYPTLNPDSTGEFPSFMLALDVPSGGTFYPVLEFMPDASSSVVEVFLVKGEYDKNYFDDKCTSYIRGIAPAARLGSVDLSTAAQGETTEVQFPAVTLDGDSVYFLVVAANGYGKGDPAWHANDKSIYSRHLITGFRLDAVATGATAKYNFTWDAWNLSANTAFDKVSSLSLEKSDTYEYENCNYKNNLTIGKDFLTFNYTVTKRNANTTNNVVTYPYVAMKISVPHAGKYSVGINGYNVFNNGSKVYGADAKIHILPVNGTFAKGLCTDQNYIGEYHFYNTTKPDKTTTARSTETLANTFDADVAGDYWLVIELRDDMGARTAADSVFNATAGSEGATYYGGNISSISITNLGFTDSEKAKAPQNVDPGNAESNNVELTDASAEIKVLTSTVAQVDGTLVTELCRDTAVGSIQSVTAPTIENQEFLYWTSGIGMDRKIVAEDEKYDFTAQKGITYLTAVYRDTTSDYVSVVFLNGNGEVVSRSDATYKEGNAVNIENLPSLTGFGIASGWQLAGTENIYKPGDNVIASGKAMIFVAQFEGEGFIDITVKNGTMTVEGEKNAPAYGDKVTVTAPSREGGSGYNVFAYWTKTVNNSDAQIVSFDREYSFSAWENCTLVAVYTERQIVPVAEKVRKILLGSMDGNVNIAEFIGCDGAIERGILYGEVTPTIDDWSNKISMGTQKSALAVINNSGKKARAYAIFENEVIYSE